MSSKPSRSIQSYTHMLLNLIQKTGIRSCGHDLFYMSYVKQLSRHTLVQHLVWDYCNRPCAVMSSNTEKYTVNPPF